MTLSAAQWEEFHTLGDANRDGHINTADIDFIQAHSPSGLGDPDYLHDADLNEDGFVDFYDVMIVAAFLETPESDVSIYDYYGEEPPTSDFSITVWLGLIIIAVLVAGVIFGKRK